MPGPTFRQYSARGDWSTAGSRLVVIVDRDRRRLPSGLAAVGPRVMNCHSGDQNSTIVAAGGPDGGRLRRRRRGIAVIADDAVPTGRRLRIRPFLSAAESLVARTPVLRAVNRQLAPRRQH